MTKLEEIFCDEFQCELANLSEQIEYVQHRTYDIQKLKNVVKIYSNWFVSQTLEELSTKVRMKFVQDDSDFMDGGYSTIDTDFIKNFRINVLL